MYINLYSAGIICWCQQWLCLSKLWTSQPQSILNLVLSSWANELPSKSLQILYGLQNKAFQQTSELLTFSSQIKLIFTRLFKSHYAVGGMQDPSLSLSFCQGLCADRGWGIPALWLNALSLDLKTSLNSTQHIPTHIIYLNPFHPYYVLNRSGIWQQRSTG